MVVVDNSADGVSPAVATRGSIARRTLICLTVGAVEGSAAALLTFGVAFVYHTLGLGIAPANFDYLFYVAFSLPAGIFHGVFAAANCDRILAGHNRQEDALISSFYAWTAALALTLLIAFLSGIAGELSRVTLTASYVVGVVTLLPLRLLSRSVLVRRIASGDLPFEKIAILGREAHVAAFLVNGTMWRRGQVLIGTLYLDRNVDVNGHIDQRAVTAFARENMRQGADHIVLLGDMLDLDELERIVEAVKRFSLNVVYAPATRNTTLKILDVVPIGPNNALRFARKPIGDADVFIKRSMDIVLSVIGLVLLSPLLIATACIIAIESKGPIIFRQARRGFNGDIFMIWKFRTMRVMESGFAMRQATSDDSRITRVGRLLRRTSIDELPQLINVLLGQMSLVGPRPHAVSHDEELELRIAKYAHRQRIKPGITGWAQVNGFRGETRTHEQIEGRIRHDIHYIENWSILFDLWILTLTVVSSTARRNAH